MKLINFALILLGVMAASVNAYWEHDTELKQSIEKSEPLNPSPKPIDFNGRKIQAEVLTTDGIEFLGDDTMRVLEAIVSVGNKLVVLDEEGVLYGFVIPAGDSPNLKIDPTFGINGRIDMRTTSSNKKMRRLGKDRIIVKSPRGFHIISDGILTKASGEIPLITDSTGNWGISPAVKTHTFTFNPDSNSYEKLLWIDRKDPTTYPEGFELYNISKGTIAGDFIYLGGSYKGVSHKGVVCIDRGSNKMLFSVSSSDMQSDAHFGHIADLELTPSGLTVLDGNMRELTLISTRGEILARVKTNDLFDLRYPWVNDSSCDSSGYLYVIAANKREGEGRVSQSFIYRVSGL